MMGQQALKVDWRERQNTEMQWQRQDETWNGEMREEMINTSSWSGITKQT